MRLVDLARPMDSTIELPFGLHETSQFGVSGDGRWMWTIVKKERRWQLWDLSTGTAEVADNDSQISLTQAEFSPDSRLLIAWGGSIGVIVWQLANNPLTPTSLGNLGSIVSRIATTSDGRCLVTADRDGVLRLHDLWELEREAVILGTHRGQIHAMQISRNDERLVTSGSDGLLKFWRLWKPGLQEIDRLRELIDLGKSILPHDK